MKEAGMSNVAALAKKSQSTLKCNIKIEGNTTDDVLMALEETHKWIKEGFTSGFDGNDSGNYVFTVEKDY